MCLLLSTAHPSALATTCIQIRLCLQMQIRRLPALQDTRDGARGVLPKPGLPCPLPAPTHHLLLQESLLPEGPVCPSPQGLLSRRLGGSRFPNTRAQVEAGVTFVRCPKVADPGPGAFQDFVSKAPFVGGEDNRCSS